MGKSITSAEDQVSIILDNCISKSKEEDRMGLDITDAIGDILTQREMDLLTRVGGLIIGKFMGDPSKAMAEMAEYVRWKCDIDGRYKVPGLMFVFQTAHATMRVLRESGPIEAIKRHAMYLEECSVSGIHPFDNSFEDLDTLAEYSLDNMEKQRDEHEKKSEKPEEIVSQRDEDSDETTF